MKFTLGFLAALALSGVVNARSTSIALTDDLNGDFQDFIDLVPQESIKSLVAEYLKEDRDVLILSMYLAGDGFRNAMRELDSMDEMLNIYKYLQESGVNAYGLLNELHDALELPPFEPRRSARSVEITGSGVDGLLADIKSLLPVGEIKALFHKKVTTSPAFVHFIVRLRDPRFHQLLVNLRANDRFQEILRYLKGHDVNVRAILALLSATFGPMFPSIEL